MEPNKEIELSQLEDVSVLENVLIRYNSIYHKNTQLVKEPSIKLVDSDSISANDAFILGGFYGAALFKKDKGIL